MDAAGAARCGTRARTAVFHLIIVLKDCFLTLPFLPQWKKRMCACGWSCMTRHSCRSRFVSPNYSFSGIASSRSARGGCVDAAGAARCGARARAASRL